MTYSKTLKSLEYIDAIFSCENEDAFSNLLQEIKNYYGGDFHCTLHIESIVYMYEDSVYNQLENDKKALAAFIRSLIDSDPVSSQIENIIDDVKKGIDSLGDRREEIKYVQYIYTTYNGKISFPKNVSYYCSGTRAAQYQVCQSINEQVVNGIIQSLKNYANVLTEDKKSVGTNIQNIFTPSNSVDVSISISIEDARREAEEAGLSKKQLDEVSSKIDEIENLINSKETKSKKWSKAGEILKWVAEQGIQVASFVVPLLCQLAR